MNEREPKKEPYKGIDNKYSLLNYSFKDIIAEWGETIFIGFSVALATAGAGGIMEINIQGGNTDQISELYNISMNLWHAGLAGLAVETGGHFVLEVSKGITQYRGGRL